MGERIGYKRVSSVGQNLDRQLEGYDLDKVFEEKLSGKDTKRPKLNEMIEYVREGDTIYIHSLDRLGRNLLDLQQLIDNITNKGVSIHFVKENLTFGLSQSSMDKLLFNIMGSFAEFERSIIKERQLEGIEKAKKQGKHLGRSKKLDTNTIKEIQDKYKQGIKSSILMKEYNISKQTLYNYLKQEV